MLRLKLGKNLVRLFQSFLRADVEPQAGHAPGIDGRARVKPLHEAAGLVGIVALGDVLLDERNGRLRIIIKRDAGERAGGIFWLFLEEGDLAGGVGGDGIIFFDLLEITHVIDGERRRIFREAEFSELAQFLAEQIVAGDHDQIVIHVLRFEDVMDVADRAELVGVVGGMVVDDGEIHFRFRRAIIVRPFLKMPGELGVGDDVNAVNLGDGREVVEDVLDHRLARDGQERFGLREGERIEARGVAGGEDDDFHL